MNGLKRGLEQMADFLNWLFWAITNQQDDALIDLIGVARVWFREMTGAQIEAKQYSVQSLVLAIVLGRDPFAGSRALFREVKDKYASARG